MPIPHSPKSRTIPDPERSRSSRRCWGTVPSPNKATYVYFCRKSSLGSSIDPETVRHQQERLISLHFDQLVPVNHRQFWNDLRQNLQQHPSIPAEPILRDRMFTHRKIQLHLDRIYDQLVQIRILLLLLDKTLPSGDFSAVGVSVALRLARAGRLRQRHFCAGHLRFDYVDSSVEIRNGFRSWWSFVSLFHNHTL